MLSREHEETAAPPPTPWSAGGVAHAGLRARTIHQAGKRLVVTGCPNAFNTVSRTVVHAKVGNGVPAVTPLVIKSHDARSPDGCFQVDSN